MNFEFLKGLRGLGYIYENCTNAEKLVKTMPVQSVFTARKSAELLAKFIFLAAHNEQMGAMSFVDILEDPTVREFISDHRVLNAFHFIRKSGNRAVHGDDKGTVEEALDVLLDLHYVAGETACMLGLIKEYPSFDSKIDSYPDARFMDEQDIEDKVKKMFLEYVEKYDAQKEREYYYQNSIDNLIKEFEGASSKFIMIPGNVDLNEVLEFKTKPINADSLKPIQSYYGFLGIRAIKKIKGELYKELADRDLEFEGELTLYGENGYTTTDLGKFVYGILHDLPFADGFKIVTKYYGPSVAPWLEANSKERNKEFSQEVAEIGQQEKFTYSVFEFLYNHGTGRVRKFENGEWVPLKDMYTVAIVDKDFGKDWWCWNFDLSVNFNYNKYPEIVNSLHECVRQRIPKDQIEYCEELWREGEVGILCNSISWYPRKLRVVQDFLDEVNEILKPIIKDCDGFGEGNWYIAESPFAIATWRWAEGGFKITGVEI